MRKQESKEIGGARFEVTQLGATQGNKVLIRLINVMGPLVTAGKEPGKGLGAAMRYLQEDDLDYFCKAFAPVTFVDGRELSREFDLYFAGKYDELFEWLVFCVQLNYGSFLKGQGLANMLGRLGPKVESKSSSPTDATGPSGAS